MALTGCCRGRRSVEDTARFVNGQGPGIGASFLNGIEDFLSQLPVADPYLRWGPFFDGIGHDSFIGLLNHIEDFLITLDATNPEQFDRNWLPVQHLGSRVPLAWIHRKDGRVIDNPDYIARPESSQYEQALVGYELCEKASK